MTCQTELRTEIYGRLRGQMTNPDKLYRDEIAPVIRSLGLTPPA